MHSRTTLLLAWMVASSAETAVPAPADDVITFESLLREMADLEAVARFPRPEYRSLQAASTNRASTHRDQPDQTASGWFADSDGLGFLRTETRGGKTEWVVLEHEGPGAITKMWTPYFWYSLDDHGGPRIRIYLDGSDTPAVDEPFIVLLRGEGSFPTPFAVPTARAGNSYLPIPFGRSCRVAMTDKPFYHIINYRAYPAGTRVGTFRPESLKTRAPILESVGKTLSLGPQAAARMLLPARSLAPGDSESVELPRGPNAVRRFTVRMPGASAAPSTLRSTVLSLEFDGEETVWCPLGDFFSSADSLHPMRTWQRSTEDDGRLSCAWPMPYRESARVRLSNLGKEAVDLELSVDIATWAWDERSMHFHANWRPDDVVPGFPFRDWNFIDISGKGVYVGDAWTVLNIQGGWWGEGDEKIYVDEAWDAGYPTHFGTGTEDYYGWAGGVNPTRRDEFSTPFLANVRVGGRHDDTSGFNICTRTRSLDAIPFHRRLVFDMESSFGVDIRNPWNLLGYSAVTFWYAFPGASHNRPAEPEAAARPILTFEGLVERSAAIRKEVEARARSVESTERKE